MRDKSVLIAVLTGAACMALGAGGGYAIGHNAGKKTIPVFTPEASELWEESVKLANAQMELTSVKMELATLKANEERRKLEDAQIEFLRNTGKK